MPQLEGRLLAHRLVATEAERERGVAPGTELVTARDQRHAEGLAGVVGGLEDVSDDTEEVGVRWQLLAHADRLTSAWSWRRLLAPIGDAKSSAAGTLGWVIS